MDELKTVVKVMGLKQETLIEWAMAKSLTENQRKALVGCYFSMSLDRIIEMMRNSLNNKEGN